MNPGSRRLLAAALLASIVLHLVILALPILREARDTLFAAPPIQARLVEPAPPAPVAAAEPQRAEPRAEPTPKKATPRPVPTLEPAPAARPLPSPPAAAEPEPPAQKVEVKPAPAAPAASAAATASPVQAAPAGQEPTTVAQYRIALMQVMARDQAYPRLARDNGWEGRVRLRVAISPVGAIAALEVLGGAGYEVLDRRALDMVRNAQPQVPVPVALRGREFNFEVPVIFSLKDAR